jgi:hypothetical protein
MNRKSLGLLLFTLILALAAGELLLRCTFPLYLADVYTAYRYDPELGYRLKDSLNLRRSTDYLEEIHTNKIGTVNFQNDFSKYHKLIFAVGDSFTQGIGVPFDASYPCQLDMLLNLKGDRYSPDYGVVNLGVAGYGVEQAILQIKRYQKIIGTPNYILFLGNGTDYQDDLNFKAGKWRRRLLEGNPEYNPLLIKPLQWLRYDTEIGKRVNLLLRKWGRPEWQPQRYVELQEPVFRKLITLAREMNATLIISWVPYRWSKEISPNYVALRQYASRNNIRFADWFPLVKAVLDQNPELPVVNPHSAGHYRPWINQMIARAFAQQIK